MIMVEFIESDEEARTEGIILCQGCASTKYPVDSRSCPTCGFPNGDYQVSLKVAKGSTNCATAKKKRSRFDDIAQVRQSIRNRKEKNRKIETQTAVHKRHTRRHLIRSGQEPLNTSSQVPTPSSRRKGIKSIHSRVTSSSTQCAPASVKHSEKYFIRGKKAMLPKISKAELLDGIDLLTLEEDEYLQELLEEAYENGRSGRVNAIPELKASFRKGRKHGLFKMLKLMIERSYVSNRLGCEKCKMKKFSLLQHEETFDKGKGRSKFLPNARTKPKVSFDETLDEGWLASTVRKTAEIGDGTGYSKSVYYKDGSVNRRKKMSFDEHLPKTDEQLEREQEKIFREAQLRQNSYELWESKSILKQVNKEKFNSVAQGNQNSRFNALFWSKGFFPDPMENDPLDVLGVPGDASLSDIRRQYKNLCFLFHPDKNSHPHAKEYFKRITDAYRKVSRTLCS